ncbi:MAG: potassium channel protein [Candidatus Eremiobacteraeota bacterium]|nr:potassium channel protein [Candidatus Eremiobacteraeota bacterium]
MSHQHVRITRERFALLHNLERMLSGPLSILGMIWFFVVVATFIWGNQPWLQQLTYGIWVVFVIDFAIRLSIAPKKLKFLRHNILIAVSLALPALAVLRIFRLLAIFPSWQIALVQLLAGVNRSLSLLSATMERRGFVYAVILTALVTVAGAAGMYRFEHSPNSNGVGINSYPYALWWTAMIMTTLGSDYFPHTLPGRILCFLLAVFAFSIFGYITAAVASYFINKDASDSRSPVAGDEEIRKVLREIASLRAELQQRGIVLSPEAGS